MARTESKFVDKEVDGKIIKYLVFSHPEQAEDLWIDTTEPATKETYEIYNYETTRFEAYSEGEKAAEWFSLITKMNVVLTRSVEVGICSTHKAELNYQLKDSDVKRSGHTDGAIHLINQK